MLRQTLAAQDRSEHRLEDDLAMVLPPDEGAARSGHADVLSAHEAPDAPVAMDPVAREAPFDLALLDIEMQMAWHSGTGAIPFSTRRRGVEWCWALLNARRPLRDDAGALEHQVSDCTRQ